MFDSFLLKIRQGIAYTWYEQEEKCLLCGKKSSGTICGGCQEKYFQPSVRRCLACGKLIGSMRSRCQDCTDGKGPHGLTRVTSLGHYEGDWKEFIHKVKFKGQPYLLLPLAEYCTSWAIKCLPPPDAVIPVPMHPKRLAQRGFNQAEILASIISRHLGIRYQEVLARKTDTLPQAALGRKERIQNLQGVFALKPKAKVHSQVLWLVDDVVTTGTTLGQCAEVLQNNGAKEVYAFCLGAGKEE